MSYFKKMKSLKLLTYDEQGDIHFTCKTYHKQPVLIRAKIDQLCAQVAKENHQALHEFLTTHKPPETIYMDTRVSDPMLYRHRIKFYERWYDYNPKMILTREQAKELLQDKNIRMMLQQMLQEEER